MNSFNPCRAEYNSTAIRITGSGNLIQGNRIGTNAAGTAATGDLGFGVFMPGGTGNLIGGTAPGAGNLISGVGQDGITIFGNPTTGNFVQGNFIGTNFDGTTVIGNGVNGVKIDVAMGNVIGGTVAGARNVISGNGQNGIFISGSETVVQGNLIGVNIHGVAVLPNGLSGVLIAGTIPNTIGGITAVPGTPPGNVISGNQREGISIVGRGNQVQGNLIGTDINGTTKLGNGHDGVRIDGTDNTLGGTAAGARNVISGNGYLTGLRNGIQILGSGNTVIGNFVGTDINGTAELGNAGNGLTIAFGQNILIGGTTAGARNLISGNDLNGIAIFTENGCTVQGNFIGTDVNGTGPLGNGDSGVVFNFAEDNLLGGVASGAGNRIAFNGMAGVRILANVRNTIRRNSIFSNEGLGIDISPPGVNPNDSGDGDGGPNNLQNFPVLTSVTASTIQGTLNSTPNTTFTIEFFSNTSCDPSEHGEGETFLGPTSVTTNASGNVAFNFSGSFTSGQFITATATDPAGNTLNFLSAAP